MTAEELAPLDFHMENPMVHPTSPYYDTLIAITEKYYDRQQMIKMTNSTNSRLNSILVRYLGFHDDLKAKDVKSLFALAGSISSKVMKGKDPGKYWLPHMDTYIHLYNASLLEFDKHRKMCEKVIAQEVKTLPIAEWWCSHRGLAEPLLGNVIGVCGDLHRYCRVSKLWKWTSLSVKDGYRQGTSPKDLSKEDKSSWVFENPPLKEKRAAMWQINSCLVRSNSPGSAGYRGLYDARKEFEIAKMGDELRACVADARARRWLDKRVLRDLWRKWRDVMEKPSAGDAYPNDGRPSRPHPEDNTPVIESPQRRVAAKA